MPDADPLTCDADAQIPAYGMVIELDADGSMLRTLQVRASVWVGVMRACELHHCCLRPPRLLAHIHGAAHRIRTRPVDPRGCPKA